MGKHTIHVQTSGGFHKGTTDCTVRLQFVEKEKHSGWVKLNKVFRNDFELGQKDVFIEDMTTEDAPTMIRLDLLNHKNTSAWACDHVEVIGPTGKVFFPVYDWIDNAETFLRGEAKLWFHKHDLYESDARKSEVEHSKSRFPWNSRPRKEGVGWGFPRFVGSITHEQLPLPFQRNDERQRDITKNTFQAAINTALTRVKGFLSNFDNFESFKNLYAYLQPGKVLPDFIDRWQTDKEYGRQQLNGISPLSFKVCNVLPKACRITDQHVGILPNSLRMEMEKGNIFIGDYSTCFQGVNRNMYDDKELVCPDAMCLYTVDNDDDLVPIAIQLIPDHEESIFSPKDEEYDWLLAKMFFKTALGSYHEWIAHFLLTHGVMEPVAVALFRCLPRCHPIYKLMRPHLQTVTAINSDARSSLLHKSSSANTSIAIEAEDMTRKSFKKFHWDDLNVPLVIQRQGLDSELLKKFYYRDDALKLWKAQEGYIDSIISLYYRTDEDVINDVELQDFVSDLGNNGFGWEDGNLRGIPEKFTTRNQLVIFLTTTMFTSSVQHAAVNFPQYEFYKFIPNCPQAMRLPVHKKGEGSMERIMATLPNEALSGLSISIAYALSSFSSVEEYLGSYQMKLFVDESALDCQLKYKKELDKITKSIEKRNQDVDYPYEVLLPGRIPNSIAI